MDWNSPRRLLAWKKKQKLQYEAPKEQSNSKFKDERIKHNGDGRGEGTVGSVLAVQVWGPKFNIPGHMWKVEHGSRCLQS